MQPASASWQPATILVPHSSARLLEFSLANTKHVLTNWQEIRGMSAGPCRYVAEMDRILPRARNKILLA